MFAKQLVKVAFWLHVVAFLSDVERYKLNLARFQAAPTFANGVRVAVAEGVLIRDLSGLL